MHLDGDARIPCLTNVFLENNFSRVQISFKIRYFTGAASGMKR